MKKYLVHFKRTALNEMHQTLVQLEQQRTAALMQEGTLTNVMLSKDMNQIWMEIRKENQEEVLEVIKSLPMCKDLYFEISEMM